MSNHITRTTWQFLMITLICVAVLGCRGSNPPPPEKPAPLVPGAAPTGDAKVLIELDYYEPMYAVNADGRVTKLRLTWRQLPTPVLAEIGKLSELQHLDLYGANITDEGFAEFKNLQKLRTLGLGGTAISDKGLVHLQKLEGLRYVWLPKQRISQEAVKNFRAECPWIADVYLQ